MNKENFLRTAIKPSANQAQVPKKAMKKRLPLQQTQHLNLPMKLSENLGDKGSMPRKPKPRMPFSNISSLFISPRISQIKEIKSD